MGYSTEQFYNLVRRGVIDREEYLNADGYSNPAFIWPGNTRKHSENGKWVDKTGVQRGFIRMLTQTKGGTASEEMKKRRCFFQFNPTTITRSVEMRSEMMHPLLQSPSEFSVPMPGNSTFAFELMFDRSFELNKGISAPPAGGGPGSDPLQNAVDDPLLTASPNSIGVLADLRMLDTIVGQGITADMMDYIIERGEIVNSFQTSDTSVSVSTPEPTEDSDSTTTDSSTTSTSSYDSSSPSWDPEQVKLAFEQNVGNQAFLMPTPVRVVFSSLFMVDGFVTSMAVTFVKFNEAMVPMQCGVSIQMQALYIGFAKKDTYLTYALDQAEARQIDAIDTGTGTSVLDKPAYDATMDLVFGSGTTKGALKDFRLTVSNSLVDNNWDTTSTWSDIPQGMTYDSGDWYLSGEWTLATPGSWANDDKEKLAYVFPGICGQVNIPFTYGFMQPENVEEDEIYNAFNEGLIKSISYSFDVTVTRTRDLSDKENEESDNSRVVVMYMSSPQLTATEPGEWDRIRRINGKRGQKDSTLVNNRGKESLKARALFLKPSTIDESSVIGITTQWNKNCMNWLASHKFRVELVLNGKILDSSDNEIPIYVRTVKDIPYETAITLRASVRSSNPANTTIGGSTGNLLS